MTLTNQIPVLDKGYVTLLSSSLTYEQFRSLHAEILKKDINNTLDNRMLEICTVHLKIVCPLFVQMTFLEYGISALTYRNQNKTEAYIPTVSDVNAINLEASQNIQKDIEGTTAALLLNPIAYQMEHCNIFISQVISPISVYNTLMVSGNLSQWLRYLAQSSLPTPIEAYRSALEDAISGEYPFVKDTLKRNRNGSKNHQGQI